MVAAFNASKAFDENAKKHIVEGKAQQKLQECQFVKVEIMKLMWTLKNVGDLNIGHNNAFAR